MAPLILEQDAGLRTLGLQVCRKCVRISHFIKVFPIIRTGEPIVHDFRRDICCVLADVYQKQVQSTVTVIIKEDGGRGMTVVVETGCGRNVGEFSLAVVFKQSVGMAHVRNVQVSVAVVVDIRK